MNKKSNFIRVIHFAILATVFAAAGIAQVTTSEIVGNVVDQNGAAVAGATVTAVHEPSGTKYSTVTNGQGRYTLPALRVGGPYVVSVTQSGFTEQKREGITIGLGNASTVDFSLGVANVGAEVTVTSDMTFNETRTGAATNVSRDVIETLPSFNRSITDFTRLAPQAGSNGSFAGQDNRMNNITVDGSYFNNSFGLRALPGQTSGVSPIAIDAIEEVQLNIAPYDVRQANFTGAGVNTVTRSGTNDYKGSVYYLWRSPGLVGKGETGTFNPGNFKFRNYGFTVGGPLPFFNFGDGANDKWYTTGKDKLFFFFSYENENTSEAGTTFRPRSAGESAGGSVTRVLKSDLDTLRSFLKSKFGYETGPYEGYSFNTPGIKYLGRLDYNINDKNKVNFRYLRLDSSTDRPLSGSSSLGFGRPNGSINFLSFEGSTYAILENIRSYQGEWTSMFTPTMSNSFLVGWTKQDESRGYKSDTLFPFVDILEQGQTYTSFGFEPFTPNNELRYTTLQVQDNLTFYRGNHTITTGFSYEHYRSENVFFPGSQSAYVYNSLQDFYDDVNRTRPVQLRRFQVRYSNIPGLDKPIQPLEVDYVGFYGQDAWKLSDNFMLTFGVRGDTPFFGDTGFTNPQANALSFRGADGQSVTYETQKLPDPAVLWSPRVGFNWSPLKSGRIQVRGGSGVFTGKPAYVWISNQIGNNGILTGFTQSDNTTSYPFFADVDHYKPTNVTGAPALTYELNFTEPNFRFPQIWRTNIGTDIRVPLGMVANAEFIYARDVNGMYYINANLPEASTAFTGNDNRPRWRAGNRIFSNISGAYVLQNQSSGKSWNMAFSLEKRYARGFYGKMGYSYGENKNLFDPGSIASGSWTSNQHYGDPNNPAMGFSQYSPGHRFFGTASYYIDYFKFGATSISAFLESRTWGNISYVFSGDLNGDASTNNDLIYIPANVSEMNFQPFTASGRTFTVAEQQEAFEHFITADSYLSKHRGQYAERNAAFLPMVTKIDLSVKQEVYFKTYGRKHRLQFSASVLNFANLLKKDWGIGIAYTTTQPLVTCSSSGAVAGSPACTAGADPSGKTYYRLRNSGSSLISEPYLKTAGLGDVYRIQLGVKYIFD